MDARLSNHDADANIVYALLDPVEDALALAQALRLEQEVWYAQGFGSLAAYEPFLDQSRAFGAFQGDACIGVARVFAGSPKPPPFLSLPILDSALRRRLEGGCRTGSVEELATSAIAAAAPRLTVALNLWRMAYRDASARNVRIWAIIMEPERVAAMNRRYGFVFEQLGPAVPYQGGNCAVHVMDLERADEQMAKAVPDRHDWFVRQTLMAPSTLNQGVTGASY